LSPTADSSSARRFLFLSPLGLARLSTLSLHDALPISFDDGALAHARLADEDRVVLLAAREDLHHPLDLPLAPHHGVDAPFAGHADRKSTRLNSSHVSISYAVFCLKKKNTCPCADRNPK